MSNRLCNSPGCTVSTLLVVILGGLLWSITVACAETGDTSAKPAQYNRADAETIRSEIQDILNDPRYAPKKSFRQWLREKFFGWEGPDIDLGGSGWLKVIFWIFTTLCILILLAILAHFIWTVFTLLRVGGGKRGINLRQPRFGIADVSYDDLRKQMLRLAQQGNFREAIGVMMGALLRRLDEIGTLRFHESKTNGDYIKEYAPDFTGRKDFERFVLSFDTTVYGGGTCRRQTYQNLNAIFEQICDNAAKE